jgi:Icc-related predicted phosphoesterase
VPASDDGSRRRPLRVAASGDVHCAQECLEDVRSGFANVAEEADVLLLAGDLTTHGEPSQAAAMADVARTIGVPVLTVLGNHDWHGDRRDDVMAELARGGIEVLEGRSTVLHLAGRTVGVAGVKGFVGGFAGRSLLADFGEPALRRLHRITEQEAQALDRALAEIEACDVRIALLHYSPTPDTLVGEPREIWMFLGSSRLAEPIAAHRPDLVLHGHAHAGAFEGKVGSVPVYNVSMQAMGRPYAVFELAPPAHPRPPAGHGVEGGRWKASEGAATNSLRQ